MPLCLLPFTAGILGRYDREPVALRIYGLVLVVIAVMGVVIWLYATNRPHLFTLTSPEPPPRASVRAAISLTASG